GAPAPGEEPDLAGVALQQLPAADPLVRQPAPHQLPRPPRPLPRLRRPLLVALPPRRAAHRPGLRRPVLPRGGPQRPRLAQGRAGVGHRSGLLPLAVVGRLGLPRAAVRAAAGGGGVRPGRPRDPAAAHPDRHLPGPDRGGLPALALAQFLAGAPAAARAAAAVRPAAGAVVAAALRRAHGAVPLAGVGAAAGLAAAGELAAG